MKSKLGLLLIITILLISQTNAQDQQSTLRIGINYGIGKQQIFPYNSPNYRYDVKHYNVLVNFSIRKSKVFSYELQFEPGIYSAKHQLLEETFMQPKDGADYLEKRKIFTKEKTITEYVLNIGFIFRYTPKERLSLFILGSVGPMFSDTETERLAKGFAFSDIVDVGLAYKAGKIMFDIATGLRHVSNLDLQSPNSGHNSSNIDFGISVIL